MSDLRKPMSDLQRRCYDIVTSEQLNFNQKARYLSLEAENNLPYVNLNDDVAKSLADGVLCDMYEGHAPYKPRYVLPDYPLFLAQGSKFLELEPAQDFDDALNLLTIIYHHVPSVTGMPVYIGHLDSLLMPYIGDLTEDQLYAKLKRFWIMLDRVLPDAFMHANIGPQDNILCRLILKIDAELQQVAPNLTFMYDPKSSPESLLLQAATNICVSSKPHIANAPLHASAFDEKGFGIVSCYNSLPLAGGGSCLSRINLKKAAELAKDRRDFMNNVLPDLSRQLIELMNARCHFLYEESNFFQSSFLVEENLIHPNRFTPMFGIYGMAECVNTLMEKEGKEDRYGRTPLAQVWSVEISKQLAEFVEATPVPYAWRERAILHSQSGISLDTGTTPGVRIPYGDEPDPVTHIMAVAPHHQYYKSGISDILTIDPTVRKNPEAMMQLCKGAFELGMREFSSNVDGNGMIRITGYMVRLSEIEKFKAQGSRTNTTVLGSEAADNCKILNRRPRVVANENCMGNDK